MNDASFRVFDGELEKLADTVTSFCFGEFGDSCEFYQVSVERVRDGGSWKVHEFRNFDEDAARAVRNHLSAGDVVRVRFGGESPEVELVVCPSEETAPVSRFVDKEGLKGLEDGQYLVVETRGSETGKRMLDEIK